MTTWRKEIEGAMLWNKESFSDIESTTLTEEQLDVKFNPSWGGTEGIPFTIWTKNHVYFPACYDGSEWVASVARNPNGEPTNHVGGG